MKPLKGSRWVGGDREGRESSQGQVGGRGGGGGDFYYFFVFCGGGVELLLFRPHNNKSRSIYWCYFRDIIVMTRIRSYYFGKIIRMN